ncbi:MAG: hypothetical protein GY772_11210, partial [bacterium]|nr:hypothetical protein [bacterium]
MRRSLGELYMTNLWAARRSEEEIAPLLRALPNPFTLQVMASLALRRFLPEVVRGVQAAVHAYSGSAVRGDGNYKIAKRLRAPTGSRPYTCIIAWVGLDGALLRPPAAHRGEAWPDLTASLEPLLQDLRRNRLAAGILADMAPPAFHATDSYNKHRRLLSGMYASVFAGWSLCANASTPKGEASGWLAPAAGGQCPTLIVGDPQHDLFALRRLVSPSCNDCRDLLRDHQDALRRLSAPPRPARLREAAFPLANRLPPAAEEVLRAAVAKPVRELSCILAAQAEAARQLREFLEQPRVLRSHTWTELFGSKPPRGVLVRLCRRLKARLHPCAGFHGYASREEFLREVLRLPRWYSRVRRESHPRRGILRDAAASGHVRGRAAAVTLKVRLHYQRLKNTLRSEGMWNWSRAAAMIREAGCTLQTGTVSVERFWATLEGWFPAAAQNVSPAWWDVLSQLIFLRYNFMHYTAVVSACSKRVS